jgi:putative transposase
VNARHAHRFSDEQIISILREAEAGVSARELCRKHAISGATFYTWRKKFGGMMEVRTIFSDF